MWNLVDEVGFPYNYGKHGKHYLLLLDVQFLSDFLGGETQIQRHAYWDSFSEEYIGVETGGLIPNDLIVAWQEE